MKTATRLFVLLSTCLFAAGVAHAYTISVDIDRSDWVMADPINLNTGHIARDDASRGEYIWRDASGDERTDFAAPDRRVDIQTFHLTADDQYLYFLLELADPTPPLGPDAPMYQIAIDLDRAPGSGNLDFGGFADTQVHPDAAWEYLIQARNGSGSSVPFVWDAGWTDQASSNGTTMVFFTASHYEGRISWQDLGFAPGAYPTGPVAFTVAMFRSDVTDNTIDLGGPGISNALDAITNYGDPGLSANTWTEVADGVIDYHFEVWFHLDPDVEPAAPVLINEVLYDPSGIETQEEWLELVNASDRDLDLAGWVITDEEAVDGSEGAFAFPAAAIVAVANAVVVARNGAGFNALESAIADFEITNTGAVPDMIAYPGWAGANFGLSNTTDEILLLDAHQTILDVVVWEGGAYPGTLPHPGAGNGVSLERCAPAFDRDDCSRDFMLRAVHTPGTLTPCLAAGDPCAEAGQCATGYCADLVCCQSACAGPCDLTCAGTVPGTCEPVTCDDLNPCTDDACDPGDGSCLYAANTDPCPNGDLCDGDEICAGGVCTTGTPLSCDDGNLCTDDSCDAASGCVFADNNAACADADLCNGDEICAGGVCTAGTPLTCDDANPCTNDSCDAATGCVFAANTATCDDGDACTANDICAGGNCAGAAVDCDDNNPCSDDSCDAALGCVHTPNAAACDDGDACTTADACADGACQGTAVDCDDGVACTSDNCDAALGCVHTPDHLDCDDTDPCTDDTCDLASGCVHAANSAACEDGDACTQNDTCAAGVCTAGTAIDCNDDIPCTDDACDAALGCVHTPNSFTCDDANPCTDDACDLSLGCINADNTAACDDGDLCSSGDVCAAGVCTGSEVDCSAADDACNVGACDPQDGSCEKIPLSDTTPCDDGDACTEGDACAAGVCAGAAVDCSVLDDGCMQGVCDVTSGNCSAMARPDDTPCDDGDPCSVGDTCQAGVCGGVTMDCSDLDGPCQQGACDPQSGACAASERPDGSSCDDGDLCTSGDQCTAGACAGVAMECPDDGPCQTSTCDPESGQCAAAPAADGTPCDDGDPCTEGEACQTGVCAAGQDICGQAAGAGCGCGQNGAAGSGWAWLLLGLFWFRRPRNRAR